MNESEITCMYLKRTMMERLCAISESGASYLVSKKYVRIINKSCFIIVNYSISMISVRKTKKPQESFET